MLSATIIVSETGSFILRKGLRVVIRGVVRGVKTENKPAPVVPQARGR
jgi:hypothetical protein